MTRDELRAICNSQGVRYKETPERLRVMDVTMLPATARAALDEHGDFIEPDDQAKALQNKPEDAAQPEEKTGSSSPSKRRKA